MKGIVAGPDWARFQKFVHRQVGKLYRWGAEVSRTEEPKDLDCSEYVERSFAEIGLTVPDGAHNQYMASRPLRPGERPALGCLGFQKRGTANCDHVVMWFSEQNVAEARGCKEHTGHTPATCPFNKVILRPIEKWLKWPHFTGWRVPLALDRCSGKSSAV